MQEIHLEGRQRIKSQEMAFTGLFAALIAAGADMRNDSPVQPVPMHCTLQFFVVLLAGYVLGARRGAACVCVYLAVG
ncbi:biotin transporter BioY, partial [Enterocloster sp.]|uniref:biotin transporter BioY n=1 Tax=Enterocloster sp. TaxID=2719315 RepID=UPI003A906655